MFLVHSSAHSWFFRLICGASFAVNYIEPITYCWVCLPWTYISEPFHHYEISPSIHERYIFCRIIRIWPGHMTFSQNVIASSFHIIHNRMCRFTCFCLPLIFLMTFYVVAKITCFCLPLIFRKTFYVVAKITCFCLPLIFLKTFYVVTKITCFCLPLILLKTFYVVAKITCFVCL